MQAIQNLLTSPPMVEEFFLNPVGLLAVLAVIPLLVFYLMKPKPEEQVMPSMMFFREEKEDDKLRKAYRKLISNLPLLLQVLAVLTFAAAFANPYTNASEALEDTVIILDQSASVKPGFEQLKHRVESEAGERNTLITASDQVQVNLEEASKSELKRTLERMKAVETETDIVSALEMAENYPGELVLASDLDQTQDNREVMSRLDNMAARPIKTISPDVSNKWGVTSVSPERNQTHIEISNFQDTVETIEVRKDGESKSIQLGPESTGTLGFTNNQGRNTVKLPQDGLAADNTATYVVPEAEKITVKRIGPVNRYLEQALNLIERVELEQVEGSLSDADVYLLTGTVRDEDRKAEIEEKVAEGASAVVMSDSSALSEIFEFNTAGKKLNSSVRINRPVNIPIGGTETIDRNITSGEAFTFPSHAIRKIGYEEGSILSYNIAGEEFRSNILYPVFWKKTLNEITDSPDISELNFETGETITVENVNSPRGQRFSGQVELNQTGFYTTDDRTYAANLESRDESHIEQRSYSGTVDQGGASEQQSIQHLAVLLLVLLICADAAYLWYRGDL